MTSFSLPVNGLVRHSISQMRGVRILVSSRTGLAIKSEIFRLCFSPIVLGMISAKMMTMNVSAPDMAAIQMLPNCSFASSVTTVVPPMFVMLFRITIIDMGRLIFSRMISSGLIPRRVLPFSPCSSAIWRTFMMGTENSAASVPEHSAEMKITRSAAINNIVIYI